MTKEEIGAVLKQFRLSSGMTQKEVAEKIGRKQQIIGHWETGYAQPDANTLFTLCDIYGTTVDEAFGFIRKNNDITVMEYEHIKKYRTLDHHGKDIVDTILIKEYDRCDAEQKMKNDQIINFQQQTDKSYLEPVAAHERTDIEATDEMKKHDDDLMNDPDIWK